MADKKTPSDKAAVQLTPGKAASPKLAPVTPGPKMVKVAVPTAKAVTAPENTAVADKPETGDAPEVSAFVKKGELFDQVATATGMKKSDVKMAIEAFLAVTAEHLEAGHDMQVPPLGKLKIMRSKPVGKGATALTIKVRTPNTE